MKNLIYILIFLPILSASQTTNRTMYFDGLNREYIIHIPSNYNEKSNMPILFSFHGGGGYASEHMQTINMNSISDTAGFIAIYPQGAIDYEGADPGTTPSTSWLHKAPTSHNDVNFISAIIDSVASEYSVDLNRVYACGYSEGGIFSYELGCRLNDKIAAFASVSGSMLTDSFRTDYGFGVCDPNHPTAVLLIPGTDDSNYHSIYSGFEPYYLSVMDITNYWSAHNNTDAIPIVNDIYDSNPNDGSTVEKREWINGNNCSSVMELKVIGGEHDWPGSFGNMDISASEEIWKFVSKYDVNGLIDCGVTDYHELSYSKKRTLINIIDVLGKNCNEQSNKVLFYVYDDGHVEKKIRINY